MGTNAILSRRRNDLKKQLAKSNQKAQKQRDEVALQLDEMRAAMAKQLERSNKREKALASRQQGRHKVGLASTYHGGGNTKYSRNYSTLASSHKSFRTKNASSNSLRR